MTDKQVKQLAEGLSERVDQAIYRALAHPHQPGDIAKAALSAIQETHAIVPKEPTEPQLMAAYGLGSDYDIYKAMLEARPKL